MRSCAFPLGNAPAPAPRLAGESRGCNIRVAWWAPWAQRRGSIVDARVIMSQEVELKLALDPDDVERFRALPLLGGAARRPLLQISTYFDTPDGDLRKA